MFCLAKSMCQHPFVFFRRNELAQYPELEGMLESQVTDGERLKLYELECKDPKGAVVYKDIYTLFAKCQSGKFH